MSFWIVTDACCDLPVSYIKAQSQFLVVPMSYQIDNQVKEIDPWDICAQKPSAAVAPYAALL